MSKPESLPNPASRALADEEVADYLRRHPDFLERRPELAMVLTPPAFRSERTVVDFHQFMIKRLQDEVGSLRDRHGELVGTARRARSFQAQIHGAVLDIMNAGSFERFVEAIATDLGVRLGLDSVALCMESHEPNPPRIRAGIRFVSPGYINKLLEGESIRIRTLIRAERKIYGGSAALVASDALVRLSISPTSPEGLLALGSRDEAFFPPGRGAELLAFLGSAIESTARAWLDLPA